MANTKARYSAEETVRLGEELYERQIRSKVEEGNRGRYIAIDVETGEYEIGEDYHSLARRILTRKPEAALCVLRIGYAAVGRLGGGEGCAMITGEVTPDKEAIIKLNVRGPSGKEQEVTAVLDTGYTEFLTLPPAIIAALGLPYQYAVPMYLADGSRVRMRVYDAVVIWDGQERSLPVQEADGDILLGMSLLYGFRLLLDAIDGGQVQISDMP